MTTVAPTFNQIRAQVASIRSKNPSAAVIGIHSLGRWTGEREIRDGDTLYVIEQCDSPLALRVALRREQPRGATKVLLTPLDANAIGEDIRIRLAKRKLFPINSWQIIQALFQAHAIDPRLTKQHWMAEKLLDLASMGDYPAAPGGFLDLETVWSVMLDRALGLGVARPDLSAVIKWSLEEANVRRFKALSEDFRKACVAWLKEATNPAVGLVLQCVQTAQRPDALPVGLAAHVVFHPQASGKLDKAVVRLEERYLGGKTADKDLCRRWSEAAREVVRLQITESKPREAILKRADAILKEIEADGFAYLSDVSLVGFEQRLGVFGEALKSALDERAPQSLDQSRQAVFDHDQAKREPRRLELIDMAVRLVRWLGKDRASLEKLPGSFSEAVRLYIEDGSFVDWARLALRNGDAAATLSDAYAMLFKKCQVIQEKQAEYFARLLQDWTAAGPKGPDPIPVENILSRVVAPIAEKNPVLLVVMDGMSVAVFNQLIDDITRRDWALITEGGDTKPLAGLATIPSITEFSRTSLLCGALRTGNSTTEQAGFLQHPDLLAKCKPGKPPLLFHKTDLHGSAEGGIPPEIRTSIASTDHRVVGVVINAIDDHLLKGEQIDMRWSREQIRALPTLLHESKLANRVVVIVSDHGHVLEFSTTCTLAEGGDRWREDGRPPGENEISIAGHRVLNSTHKVIAPWSECVRYAIKKNGYHGGVSPQEMVVPIAVLAASEDLLEGWAEKVFASPAWWSAEDQKKTAHPEPAKAPAKKPKEPVESLLDWREEDDTPPVKNEQVPAWIGTLIASPVFQEQKKLSGRSFPKNEQVFVELLCALESGGGKLTSAALSRSLGYPAIRLAGLLAVCQRVLNLDGYEVLGRDEDSDTVELNAALLRKQFEID